MQNNVLDYLESSVQCVPNKCAYSDGTESMTFREVHDQARAIGSFLVNRQITKEPVIVFMRKSPQAVTAFYGAVYGGNFYVPLDEEMPAFRVQLILDTVQAKVIICDETTKPLVEQFVQQGKVYEYEEMIQHPIDTNKLTQVYEEMIDTDPLYIVFTSGSTGVPKGVVACHRSVIDYIENLSEVLQVSRETVFGNQSPLYFDACLKELYPTLKFGATTYLIPKQLFMMPIKLVEYLNTYQINTICWVVSALTIISSLGTFKKIIPTTLQTIAFGSEVFPIKQFNKWREVLSDARFIHLYGPTEATGMSCYYHVTRPFEENERIPIGRPFKNTGILLLDESDQLVEGEGVGEICIRGTAVTLGYYKAFDRTQEVFVQNPLNQSYQDLVYRTGDLAKRNSNHELIFISRKDYQIKHMGHRIELGEIEVCVHRLEHIQSVCALYDEKTQKIILYYVGDYEPSALIGELKGMLPRYMLPNKTYKLEQMPLTSNGKINRNELKQQIN